MTGFTKIKPLTDFLENSETHIGNLRTSGEAELLTVNGEEAIVVQDAASYRLLQQLAEQSIQDERLQQAIEDAKNSKPVDTIQTVFERIRKKWVN